MIGKKRRGKNNPEPSTGDLIREYDKAAVEAAWRWKQAKFDHSPATLEVLEEMLAELHHELGRKDVKRRVGLGLNENDAILWSNVFGIYLGETIRRMVGAGEWTTGQSEAPNLLALKLPGDNVAFPTAQVFRCLEEGASESVLDYFAEWEARCM